MKKKVTTFADDFLPIWEQFCQETCIMRDNGQRVIDDSLLAFTKWLRLKQNPLPSKSKRKV